MNVSKREKRFLVAGMIALAGYLAIIYLIEPFVIAQREIREEIRVKRAVLEQYRSRSEDRERYQQRVDALKTRLQQAEVLLLGAEKAPVAAAKVQGLVHSFGQETDMTIVREHVAPLRKLEGLVEVPVEVSLRGDLKAVRDFLYRVQTAGPLVTVPKLVIRSGFTHPESTLSVDLRVAGYIVGVEEKQ